LFKKITPYFRKKPIDGSNKTILVGVLLNNEISKPSPFPLDTAFDRDIRIEIGSGI
jgi:hypothetical protein